MMGPSLGRSKTAPVKKPLKLRDENDLPLSRRRPLVRNRTFDGHGPAIEVHPPCVPKHRFGPTLEDFFRIPSQGSKPQKKLDHQIVPDQIRRAKVLR